MLEAGSVAAAVLGIVDSDDVDVDVEVFVADKAENSFSMRGSAVMSVLDTSSGSS